MLIFARTHSGHSFISSAVLDHTQDRGPGFSNGRHEKCRQDAKSVMRVEQTKDRLHVREYTAIRIKLPLRVVTVSLGIGPVSDREIGASLLESLAGDMRKLHEFRRAPSPSLSVFQGLNIFACRIVNG